MNPSGQIDRETRRAVERIGRWRRLARIASWAISALAIGTVFIARIPWLAIPAVAAMFTLTVVRFLASSMLCPACGVELLDGRRFFRTMATSCPGCGLPTD